MKIPKSDKLQMNIKLTRNCSRNSHQLLHHHTTAGADERRGSPKSADTCLSNQILMLGGSFYAMTISLAAHAQIPKF